MAVAGSNLAVRPILLLKSFIVAKYLGPADYGLFKTIELIQMLNKYGNLGFRQTANREVGDLIGKKSTANVGLVKNTLYSSELILSLILFFIGTSISLFFDDKSISIMIIVASFGLLASKIRGILNTEAVIQKNFILHSKVAFITTLIASITIIVTVPYLKIYAMLLTNIIVGVIAIGCYLKYLNFKFSFIIAKKEFKRLFKISISLTVPTLALGLFKYTERILVIIFLGPLALGFYSFGEMISAQISTIFKLPIKVRMQDIYEGLGAGEYLKIHKMVVKETTILTLLTIAIIPIAWYLLQLFIPIFLSNWVDGIVYAQIFLFVMPFHIIPNYIVNVLLSSLVNKQFIVSIFQFIGSLILAIHTFSMYTLNILTIERFIIFDILAIAFYSISLIILYKIYFFNVFVTKKIY